MKRPKHPEQAGQRGFTLVELLVVIGIMALLAGMIGGVAYSLRAKAKRDRTRTLIDKVQTALEDYRTSIGRWPDAVPVPPAPTDYEKLAEILLDMEAVEPSDVRGDVVVDAWGNPIFLMRDGYSAPGLDIWSAGPDGENDYPTVSPDDYDDDVVNWARE